MFKKFFSSKKVSIAQNANNNIIMQDSVISNPVFCVDGPDIIRTFGKLGQYDMVQQLAIQTMSESGKTHPLYPVFSARFNNDLQKLVSAPATEDALKQYPKHIKGKYQVNYKKYPYMNKSETPWEYAYRTQTTVELKTTAYQEYLGEIVDPFPIVEYVNGMIMRIKPPQFPSAVEATIAAGDVSIPILLRRKPCMDYGKIVFGTVLSNQGFDLDVTTYQDFSKTDFKITKVPGCELSIQLEREKLFSELYKTKHVTISIDSSPLVDATLNEEELSDSMFQAASYMVKYLENLLTIEKFTFCKFDFKIDDVLSDDYLVAQILASSLGGSWCKIKADFDNSMRCDYDHIPDVWIDGKTPLSDVMIQGKVSSICLQGQQFLADKYTAIYKGARINNISSVIKNLKKKKKNILITFRPVNGESFFFKYCKFDGIRVLSSNQ